MPPPTPVAIAAPTLSEAEKIRIICSQTDYTQEAAKAHLSENNQDYIVVIKKFLNIDVENEGAAKQQCRTGSQERFRLCRTTVYKDNHLKTLQ